MSCFSPWKLVCSVALAMALPLAQTPRAWSAHQEEIQKKIEETQEGIVRAQQQLILLLDSGATAQDEGAKKTAQGLSQEVAALMAGLEKLQRLKQMLAEIRENEAQAGEVEISRLNDALAKSQAQTAELNAQLAAMEREREERPIDGAQIKIFTLKNSRAQEAAMTVQEVLSGSPFRLSADPATNSLIVAGDEKTLEVIEALLLRLDASAGSVEPAASREAARSLFVRVFWLADGLAADEGSPPIGPLPQKVVDAVAQLGLNGPKLVSQTVNAISRDGNSEERTRFSSNIPGLIFGQPATLSCRGSMKPIRDNRAELDVAIQVVGPTINTELGGSIVTPLGHYMVLGTANSVIPDPATLPAGGMSRGGGRGGFDGGRGGMEFGGGRGGFEGGRGGEMGGRDGGSGRDGGRDEFEGAARDEVGDVPARVPQYKTSRFAFVVQVVEAESFAPEE